MRRRQSLCDHQRERRLGSACTDADHVTYLVGGDSRGDKAGVVRWAFGQAKAVGARGFLFLGDMEWSYACDTHFRQQQVSYLSPIPFYPVLGNHEIAWFGFLKGKARGVDGALDAERIFQKNFLATPADTRLVDVQGQGGLLRRSREGPSFRRARQRDRFGFGAEQLDWLEQDLKKARSDAKTKHIVVGMHKPLADNCTGGHSMAEGGSVGREDSQKALAMFQQYGVSMVLASHVHQFAQFKQGGIQTYITGGLGAHLRGCNCGDCQAFHHLLRLDVSESDIRVTVIRFPGSQVWSKGESDDDDDNAFPGSAMRGGASPRFTGCPRRAAGRGPRPLYSATASVSSTPIVHLARGAVNR